MSEPTQLERFVFNQARFVFMTAYTIERIKIIESLHWTEALRRIRETPNGQKFLKHVPDYEIREEMHDPGSFMKNYALDANTIDKWLNSEYGTITYVEEFKEL